MTVNIKRTAAFILAAALAFPGTGAFAEETASDVQTQVSEDEVENGGYVFRDPAAVLSGMTAAAENEKYRFCYSPDEDLFALADRESGYVWWSSPVNAEGDPNARGQIKKEIESSLVVTGGEPDSRSVFTLRSAGNAKIQYRQIQNGVCVTYRFPSAGFVIPVEYTLEDDCISAKVVTADIKESKRDEKDPKILLSVSVLPNLTTVSGSEKGYYIIPDGCGAVIDLDSRKTGVREYSASVYGDDITAVPSSKPSVSEKVSMPVYGVIKEREGSLLAVISQGDSNAQIKASVSGISKCSYDLCSSSFTVRSTDTYYMDKEPLTVFQNGDILTPFLEMKFFPLRKRGAGFEDAAAVYRDYLVREKNVAAKPGEMPMFINLYGAARKKEPVLGIPVTVSKAFTTFEQAEQIAEALVLKGAGKMAFTMDNWTDAGIKCKIDKKAAPSSVLGSKKAFTHMCSFFDEKGISFFPSVNNTTFRSGNGYHTFSDTAVRASGQYSRQVSFNLAYSTQNTLLPALSLTSPSCYSEIYRSIASDYQKKGISGVCVCDAASVLYSDFGKEPLCRNDMMEIVSGGLGEIKSASVSVALRSPNAYAFRYAGYITDVPLSSGRFDIFDGDIPFWQTVMHGLVPFSSVPVNRCADPDAAVLSAVSSGCGLSFDMVYEDTSELKDTEYDRLFYAGYGYWTDYAASADRFVRDILEGTQNDTITGWERKGDISVTEFSSGKKISVDYRNKTVTASGKTYVLSDYLSGKGE